MTTPELVAIWTSVGTLIFSVATWVVARLGTQGKRLRTIESRLVKLETQIEPLWRDVAFAAVHAAAKVLHSPDNELGLDEYIDRLMGDQLTADDIERFVSLLERAQLNGIVTPTKRLAIEILLRELSRRRD